MLLDPSLILRKKHQELIDKSKEATKICDAVRFIVYIDANLRHEVFSIVERGVLQGSK